MPRKHTPHWLLRFLEAHNFRMQATGRPLVSLPTCDADAGPVIKLLDDALDMELLSEDGELDADEVEAKQGIIFRAKGDLELILGHKVTLENF